MTELSRLDPLKLVSTAELLARRVHERFPDSGLSRLSKVHRCAGLFYWVHSGRTGRGVATAAIEAMARLAFSELGLRRVEMLIAEKVSTDKVVVTATNR